MTILDHLTFPIQLVLALFQRRRERKEMALYRSGAGQVALGYQVSARTPNAARKDGVRRGPESVGALPAGC